MNATAVTITLTLPDAVVDSMGCTVRVTLSGRAPSSWRLWVATPPAERLPSRTRWRTVSRMSRGSRSSMNS